MASQTIQAIDVHGHYGRYLRGNAQDLVNDFMTGDADLVVRRARQANTRWTVVSPLQALLPRGGGDPVAGNEDAFEVVDRTEGLLQWVVIDPTKPQTYEQAERMLQSPRCVGIKVHPEEHCYPITEHGRAIFAFAAQRRAAMLVHSSEQNSLAADYVCFANDFPEVRLILAHIGCGWDGDLTHQVRALQQSRHGNVFADTSSARSVTPNLIEWAVKEVGANRVLYGTDTPLYFAPMQRARIDHADLSEHERRLVLRDNAIGLLGLAERLGGEL